MVDILDEIFKHPDLALDTPLLDEAVAVQIHRSHDNYVDLNEHWRETRKLFGGDFHAEYGRPAVRQVLRDSGRTL